MAGLLHTLCQSEDNVHYFASAAAPAGVLAVGLYRTRLEYR